jgi:hypothetical protein
MVDSGNGDGKDAESSEDQKPTPTPEGQVISESAQRCPKDEVRKQGLLWTFKKGGRLGTDELTITVVDILEKRVKLSAQIGGSDITCSGPASLELQLNSITLSVEEVGNKKTKLRIVSRRMVAIRRE